MLPAAWRWFGACVQSRHGGGSERVQMLGQAALQRVDRALRCRDIVHIEIAKPDSRDAAGEALFHLNALLVALGGAFDAVARVAHIVYEMLPSQFRSANWKGAWLKELRGADSSLAARTDLAWQLLKEMADEDPELAERLEMEGKDWVTRGIAVVEELVKLPGPWKDRIQAPNQKVRRSDTLTIPQAQFVRSLRPLLDMPLMARAEPAKIAQLINAYWQGIAAVLPEPFLPGTNPKEYAIQKGQGAVALHRVLPQAIESVRSRGESLNQPTPYAEVMKNLPNLSGEIVTDMGPVPVRGADFWRSGSEGVASQFSGDAGRKRLSVLIRQLMPKPAEELNF